MTTVDGRVAWNGLRGALIGLAWVGGLFAAAPIVGGFGLVPIADVVIAVSPGWFAATMIGLLGSLAQPALVAGIVLALTAFTATVGVCWSRVSGTDRRTAEGLAIAIGAVASGWLFVGVGAGVSGDTLVAVVLAVAPAYLVAGLFGDRWPVIAERSSESEATTPPGRRRFFGRVGVLFAGALSLGAIRGLLGRLLGPHAADRATEPLPHEVSPPTGDPAFDFAGMPAAVTDPSDHYVIDINVNTPVVDAEDWTLDVEGAVSSPYSIGYDELLAHDDQVEQTTTMVCISNEIGGDLMGTAHWTGVMLSDLVAAAEPADEAVDVVTHAADGYNEAFPIEQVEREDILLVYGMGERTLAEEHGFPVRLLIPGRYGMKMTKWITRIELTTAEHEAYWQERGWNEEAVMQTMSYVRGIERDGDRVQVGGVAFAGLETGFEEIDAVEVSVDGGDTWSEAELEPQLDPHARRRWRYAFDAPDGNEFEVVSRAIERDGTVQIEHETSPRPNGATGWHRVVLDADGG